MDPFVEPDELRRQVRDKYSEVATEPQRSFHFHAGPDDLDGVAAADQEKVASATEAT